MHFRTILSGTLAALLVSATAVQTVHAGQGSEPDSGFSFHLPSLGVFGDKKQEPSRTQIAQQSGPVGATGVEEQIRQMNGRIEELNFQVLQMQEQIRKQQEDNEFRFQQLEGGGQGAQKKSDATGLSQGKMAEASRTQPTGDAGQSSDQIGEVIIDSGNGDPGKVVQGAPAKTFGTITVDKNGNVVDAGQQGAGQQGAAQQDNGQEGAVQGSAELPPAAADDAPDGGAVVAALPPTDNADELYRNSYQFILSGDYRTAEQGFRDYTTRFPKDAKSADAHYWLGESLLGQQKYHDAAEVFLAASKNYPKAKKAPDMLLKLGVALVGLNQRDVACATFGEVGKRYPGISSALKERVKQERALASC